MPAFYYSARRARSDPRMTIRAVGEHLRLLVAECSWSGTVTELAAALNAPRIFAPPHLAVWLRRHEPTLWWTFGVYVRFSRTGRKRLVHLSRREESDATGQL